MKKVIVLGAMLALGGCATLDAIKELVDYNSTYSRVTFTVDQYKGTRTYKTPLLTLKDVKFGESDLMMGYLSYTKAKDGDELYCLMTMYNNKGWAFFNKAYDINQKELPVINGRRDVGKMFNEVQISENNCIQLNRAYMDSAASTNGLNIKLVGENKQQVIKVGAYYVKAFLDAVDYSEKTRFNGQ